MFVSVNNDRSLLLINASFIESITWAKHCAKLFINIKSNIYNTIWGRYYCFCFEDEVNKSQSLNYLLKSTQKEVTEGTSV